MIELRPLLDAVQELAAERYARPQLVLLLQYPLAHPLQLRSGEVPLHGHVAALQVLLDRGEAPDGEAVLPHLLHIAFRHGELARGDQVDLHVVEYLESVRLGMDRTSMIQVSDQRDMQVREVHAVVLEERVLVQKLLCRMLVLAVSGIDECRLDRKTVAPRVVAALLVQIAAQPLDLATHDEDAVAVAGEHVERVGIALALVDGR